MKVVLICGRFPEPGMKGDQVRTWQQVGLLSERHDVTVVTGGAPSSPSARRELEALATVILVPAGGAARVLGVVRAAFRGLPLEVGWFSPPAFARASAALAVRADVAIVSTVRCLPRALPAPTVLDHIDALSANLRQRARLERRLALRLGARIEASLLGVHERRAARWCAAQTVVSSLDADALPGSPPIVVIPHVYSASVDEEDAGEPRDIDLIATGDMRYPPNREAAEWLVREIVPRLRALRPDVRVVVAGRSAAALPLAGVEVQSDVPDLHALLRRARVAAVPLLSGTGAPNKLLEAAAAGAAVVATPRAASAVGLDVETAGDADGFAAAVDRLLSDDALRAGRSGAALAGLRARRAEVVGAALERLLLDACENRMGYKG